MGAGKENADGISTPVNQIVGLLHNHAPNVLLKLREDFPDPESQALLMPGLIGGKTDKLLRLRANTATEGLKIAIKLCDDLTPKLRKKLVRANRLQAIGQVTTIIGGGSVLGTLLANFEKLYTYATACITLLGSLIPVLVQYVEKPVSPSGLGLFDLYKDIADYRMKAKLCLMELEPWIASGYKGDVSDGVIAQANDICAHIENLASNV